MHINGKSKLQQQDIVSPQSPENCPVEDWCTFLGHRWISLLLWHLSVSSKRHGELADLLPGISAKVLTERLNSLVLRGLIKKEPQATFPRTVKYTLSPQGIKIVDILGLIEKWSKTTDTNTSIR